MTPNTVTLHGGPSDGLTIDVAAGVDVIEVWDPPPMTQQPSDAVGHLTPTVKPTDLVRGHISQYRRTGRHTFAHITEEAHR